MYKLEGTLVPGNLYHYRAVANNSNDTAYGSDMMFLTKPYQPANFEATTYSSAQINLTWTIGDGADATFIVRKEGSYPSDRTDGINVYNGSGTSYEDTGLKCETHYFYRAWSYCSDNGLHQWSDDYDSINVTTFVGLNYVYVDDDYNESTPGWQIDRFDKIQHGINAVSDGGTVFVFNGTYNENIVIDKTICLIGENRDSTIINGAGGKIAVHFIPGSERSNISGFKVINHNAWGIHVKYNENAPADITIYENSFYDCFDPIRVEDVNRVYIFDNRIENCGHTLINDCNVFEIRNCIFTNNWHSQTIYLNCADDGIISGNLICNNSGEGIHLDFCENDTIIENTIRDNGGHRWCEGGIFIRRKKPGASLNLFYHNNIINNSPRNAKDDVGKDIWDNGYPSGGNYWSDYTGQDNYHGPNQDIPGEDGIGDTSYTISQENKDEFPLMSMIFPDIISVPTNVELVTTPWDDTPSLTWNPSTYSKGIEGYYVKIDSNPETYVGDTTSWTSPDAVSDGVHTFYVRAKGTDSTTGAYASITFSIATMFIDTDEDGWSDEEEQEYNTDPNDPDNYPLDTDSDRIHDSVDTDDDNDGYSDDMELSYGTDAKDSNDYPTDTDGDGVPDNVSPDGEYAGDIDDDDDSLIDTIEANLGSNPQDGSDAKKIYIGGKPYYLIDVTQDGVYDILYEPTDDTTTAVEKYNENYLIDENGDGTWDYIYSTSDGSVSPYEEQLILPFVVWILLILVILLAALFVSSYYLRRRPIKYKIPRKPERVIERPLIEKPLRFIAGEKTDTVEMISQTKILLQRIQQDVEAYMEKLREMEDQFMIPIEEEEEMEELPEEKPSELEDIHDIEAEVDKLLSALDDEDKN
jgi:parallel beta-helix repeat protein